MHSLEMIRVLNEKAAGYDDLDRQFKQVEVNCKFLMDAIDEIHSSLCLSQYGTWQDRTKQAIRAARAIGRASDEARARATECKPILETHEQLPGRSV